jgi:hypothetical protein
MLLTDSPAHDAESAANLDRVLPAREVRALKIVGRDNGVKGVARHIVVALHAVGDPVLQCQGKREKAEGW